MYHMNLGVWRHDEFIMGTCEQAELDHLDRSLLAMSIDHDSKALVKWGLRQIVVECIGP